MLRSMTGFGHDERMRDGATITVEMKTVNHRYCDIYLRMPKQFNCFEERVRTTLSSRIVRGKLDVFVTLDQPTIDAQTVVTDLSLAGSYLSAIRQIASELGVQDDVTANMLGRFPDVLRLERRELDDSLGDLLMEAVRGAIDVLADMREREGRRLEETLQGNLKSMESTLKRIADQAPTVVQDYKERLDTRIAELVDTQKLDPVRLATEVALVADKCSIDEELVRMGSHLEQMSEMLHEGSPIGKKLDFLIQEMNREVNTIGSKSNNLGITRLVVELKSEIEKMREQIQNIE